MSDSPDLTPEDVSEILRIVDSSQFDEFELETPRLTIRFRRGEPPVTGSAPTPVSVSATAIPDAVTEPTFSSASPYAAVEPASISTGPVLSSEMTGR